MSKLTDEKIADLLGRTMPKNGSQYTRICGARWGMIAKAWKKIGGDEMDADRAQANAEAIALVPELLAEVARLRSQATELCALLADAYGAYLDFDEILKGRADHEVTVRLEAAEAKVERLRDEIAYRDMRDD